MEVNGNDGILYLKVPFMVKNDFRKIMKRSRWNPENKLYVIEIKYYTKDDIKRVLDLAYQDSYIYCPKKIYKTTHRNVMETNDVIKLFNIKKEEEQLPFLF